MQTPPSLAWLDGAFCNAKPLGRYGHGYCSGGFFSEPGLTDRIQVMTYQRSSEVLKIPPKGGIGPTTTSCLTRL